MVDDDLTPRHFVHFDGDLPSLAGGFKFGDGSRLIFIMLEEQPSIWVNDELYSNDLTATKPWNDSECR